MSCLIKSQPVMRQLPIWHQKLRSSCSSSEPSHDLPNLVSSRLDKPNILIRSHSKCRGVTLWRRDEEKIGDRSRGGHSPNVIPAVSKPEIAVWPSTQRAKIV